MITAITVLGCARNFGLGILSSKTVWQTRTFSLVAIGGFDGSLALVLWLDNLRHLSQLDRRSAAVCRLYRTLYSLGAQAAGSQSRRIVSTSVGHRPPREGDSLDGSD